MELLLHQAHKARSDSAEVYVRQRPETTLLFQIVQEYWSEFQVKGKVSALQQHPAHQYIGNANAKDISAL